MKWAPLNVALWALQIVLAALFVMAGVTKVFTTQPELGLQIPWVLDVPTGVTLLAGWADLLGGIGLVLPAATRLLPWLTPLAAAALVAQMVLATVFHLTRGEPGAVGFTLVLGLLCALVAWGRHRTLPIAPRGV